MEQKTSRYLSSAVIDKTERRFIIVYETIYKTNLNADELALIIKLLASAPTFKPNYNKLEKILKIGKKRLTKAVKGLKDKGFLEIEKKGKNGTLWIINQEPKDKPFLNFEILKEQAEHLRLTFEAIQNAFNMKIITKSEAQKLIEITNQKGIEIRNRFYEID